MKKFCLFILLMLSMTASAEIKTDSFKISPIDDIVFARMKGKSYPKNCKINRKDLCYVEVYHYDYRGKEHKGEIVCNKRIAKDLVEIFRELHANKYPIEKMTLIDNYDAVDEASMQDNNTSCFCYRTVAGRKTLSKHARGLAIDINPFYNPCVTKKKDGTVTIQPSNASLYTDRTKQYPYKIEKGDLCYNLFKKHGFSWGGDWRGSTKDYQHFEK